MLFGTFPGVTVADSGCSASQKCEKNSCKEQELLQEQSEIKILSGFCWEKERLDLGTLQTPARNRRGKLQAKNWRGNPLSAHKSKKHLGFCPKCAILHPRLLVCITIFHQSQ